MTRTLLIFALLTLAACASHPPAEPYTWEMDFDTVAAQQQQQAEADWHGEYQQALMAVHERHWPDYSWTCSRYLLAAGYTEMDLLYVLDADGQVLGMRTRPNIPEAQCFADFFSSVDFPRPGRLFYGRLHIADIDQWPAPQQANNQSDGDFEGASLRQMLTGRWGWNREQCSNDPIKISFSDDGATMYHRSDSGLYLGDKSEPKDEVIYHILGESERVMRTVIQGEDRRTPDGSLVGWDLIVLDDDAFCWHRWDWPEGCTQPLKACD